MITIVAHRGLHHVFPENSLQGFQAAWESGIIWAECDVQFTRDEAAVVLHDQTLERTTTGRGRVAARSLAELRPLRLRDAAGKMTDYSLPTLQEVLEGMPPHAALLIEFKQIPATAPAIDLLSRCAIRRVAYQSFHEQDMTLFERANPSEGFSWLLDARSEIEAGIRSRWPSLHVNYESLDESLARRILQSGKTFGAWTVNDEINLRRIAGIGAKTLITDLPDLARRALAAR